MRCRDMVWCGVVACSEDVRREAQSKGLRSAIEQAVQALPAPARPPIFYGSREQLSLMSAARPHNGFVLDAAPLKPALIGSLVLVSTLCLFFLFLFRLTSLHSL
jgi:hypothetical protein